MKEAHVDLKTVRHRTAIEKARKLQTTDNLVKVFQKPASLEERNNKDELLAGSRLARKERSSVYARGGS